MSGFFCETLRFRPQILTEKDTDFHGFYGEWATSLAVGELPLFMNVLFRQPLVELLGSRQRIHPTYPLGVGHLAGEICEE